VIYLCIPAHNESATLGILLWKLRKVMAEFARDYEILVLDDGSSDDTADVLSRYQRSLPLRVVGSDDRLGYAGAVERLLREVARISKYPKRDLAILLQGDFTENPEDLVAMAKAVEGGADVVAGYPGLSIGAFPLKLRWVQGLGRWLLGKPGANVPADADPLSSYRAYRVVVLRRVFQGKDPVLKGESRWAVSAGLFRETVAQARRVEALSYRMQVAPQARESRFRLMPALQTLLPLRGVLRGTTTAPPPQPRVREAA